MRPFLWATTIAFVSIVDAVAASDQADPTADGYHLVWADEFDKEGKLNEKN